MTQRVVENHFPLFSYASTLPELSIRDVRKVAVFLGFNNWRNGLLTLGFNPPAHEAFDAIRLYEAPSTAEKYRDRLMLQDADAFDARAEGFPAWRTYWTERGIHRGKFDESSSYDVLPAMSIGFPSTFSVVNIGLSMNDFVCVDGQGRFKLLSDWDVVVPPAGSLVIDDVDIGSATVVGLKASKLTLLAVSGMNPRIQLEPDATVHIETKRAPRSLMIASDSPDQISVSGTNAVWCPLRGGQRALLPDGHRGALVGQSVAIDAAAKVGRAVGLVIEALSVAP